MPDPNIIPGAWVATPHGEAVVVAVEPHEHVREEFIDADGICHCACETDACEGALHVLYRYKAHRYKYDAEGNNIGLEDTAIWVLNGSLTDGCGDFNVTFLRESDEESAHVLSLTGPYGEGPILPARPPDAPMVGPVNEVQAPFADVDAHISVVRFVCWEKRPGWAAGDAMGDAELAIFAEWDAWGEEVERAALAELGWTLDAYRAKEDEQTAEFYRALAE